MAKYMYVWDFGAGLGHLVMAKPILEHLLKNNNQVLLVVPDVEQARCYCGVQDLEIIERPTLGPGISPPQRISRCWTELQLELGYGQAMQLTKNIHAWQKLLADFRPHCVLADYSLSLQILRAVWKFPLIRLGNGFCCPPPSVLMAEFFPDYPVSFVERSAIDTKLLQAVTTAQQATCGDAVQNLQELFTANATVLWTVSELDHFPQRKAAESFEYLGPISSSHAGIPNWCHSGTPKILVYLWNFPGIELILDYLKIVRFDTLVIQRDFSESLIQKYSCRHLRFVPAALNMQRALAECDLFIGNCGPGTAFDALSAGKPCILCPAHVEQAILGIQLQAQGLARVFWRQEPEQAIAEIQNFFDSPQAFTKAREISQKLRPFSIAEQLQRLSNILTNV